MDKARNAEQWRSLQDGFRLVGFSDDDTLQTTTYVRACVFCVCLCVHVSA